MKSKKELIKDAIQSSVINLIYRDRAEDEKLPKGEIESIIESEEISIDEMTEMFRESLKDFLVIN